MGRSIPNEIIHHFPDENTTTIRVERRDGSKHDILINFYMWPLLEGLHFHVNPTRHGREEMYAKTYVYGRSWQLHRFIAEGDLMIDPQGRKEIDHRNRQTLDCRTQNLFPASRKEQMQNTRRSHKETPSNA